MKRKTQDHKNNFHEISIHWVGEQKKIISSNKVLQLYAIMFQTSTDKNLNAIKIYALIRRKLEISLHRKTIEEFSELDLIYLNISKLEA